MLPLGWIAVNPWGLVGRHEVRLLIGWTTLAVSLRWLCRCEEVRVPRWWREACAALALALLSVVVNRDWWTTLLGHADRHLGLVGWSSIALAVLIGINLDDWGRGAFRRAVELAGAIVAVVAIGQLVLPAVFGETAAGGRPTSTFGSAAFSGAALAVAVVFWADRVVAAEDRRPGALAAAGAVVTGVGLALTGSRGAWIGGLLGLGLLLARHRTAHRRRVVAVAGTGVLLVGLAIASSSTVRGRLISYASPNSGTAGGRLVLWKSGVRSIAERPILGWGPDRTRVGLPPSLPRSFEATYWDQTIPDRVHNAWLDLAVVFGLPLALLVLWLAARATADVLATPLDSQRRVWGIAAAAHLPHLAFNFVQLDVDLVVAVVVGVAIGGSAISVGPSRAVRTVWSWAATGSIVAAAVFGLGLTVADSLAGGGLRAEERGDVEAARDAYRAAQTFSFGDARFAEIRARFERRVDGPASAIDAADHAASRHRDDPFFSELPALVRAEASQTQPGLAHDALLRYERLVDRWPNHASYYTGIGIAEAASGDAEAAERSFRTAAELSPLSDEPYVNLALLLLGLDRPDEAEEVIARGLATARDTDALRALRAQTP